ncbi:ABC transporter permease [Terrisporobacter glycolicus]|uniref:ABC transporter permease n=1 Tax=Terrisporobacter glycolicus TaxID=36841 RepID=UPI003464963C
MLKKQDIATNLLCIILVAILFMNQFMFKAEQRIGDKIGLSAKECLGSNYMIILTLTFILLIVVIIKEDKENLNFISGMLASICLGCAVLFAGQAVNVVELSSASGRVSMSLGCYLYILLAYLVIAKCNENIHTTWKRFVVIITGIAISVISAAMGELDGLSIVKEYMVYKSQFYEYFSNHLSMSFKVVISGVFVGIPLGWFVYKNSKIGKVISAILNTIESIPSFALICIMMFPLSVISKIFPILREYGISGVGSTPVFCALFCYSLFQIVNSMYGALDIVDKEYINVARGMGMTTMQIFIKVELPIIFPIIISGIRVSLTATILGVTIGSYIGYGGLGKFILQGLNGFAIDLVMLGTLPIMGLVLLFDFCFRKLIDLIESYRKIKGAIKI